MPESHHLFRIGPGEIRNGSEHDKEFEANERQAGRARKNLRNELGLNIA
jgi:hypothetical protein